MMPWYNVGYQSYSQAGTNLIITKTHNNQDYLFLDPPQHIFFGGLDVEAPCHMLSLKMALSRVTKAVTCHVIPKMSL